MGFRQSLLVLPILIIYLFVAIFDGLKRLFESIGEKLTDIAFKKWNL